MQTILTRVSALGLIMLIGFQLTAFAQAAWGVATLGG